MRILELLLPAPKKALSVDEWAEAVIESVDKIKEKYIEEDGHRYVGGSLKFTAPADGSKIIKISFTLYFQDAAQQWVKAEASSDAPESGFTRDALQELAQSGEIAFEVE